MTEQQLIAAYITVGVRILTARLVLLLSLFLTFSLFAWTMAQPSYERVAAALIFAVLVYLPATRMDSKLKPQRAVISPEATDG